jgi:hypothetical protein
LLSIDPDHAGRLIQTSITLRARPSQPTTRDATAGPGRFDERRERVRMAPRLQAALDAGGCTGFGQSRVFCVYGQA